MGTKLSACQNAIMALIFPVNHSKKKKIHLLVSPYWGFLSAPQLPKNLCMTWSNGLSRAWEYWVGREWPVHTGYPAFRILTVGSSPGWSCSSSPAAEEMLWSGSCTGCRAPDVLILSVHAHSVPWRQGPMWESASAPHCASSLRLQGPGFGWGSGHTLPPPFGAWCDFYQVDLGYNQTLALEDFSPHPS